ncbi:14912_t:CDS:2, partial [Gigaspora rosea]
TTSFVRTFACGPLPPIKIIMVRISDSKCSRIYALYKEGFPSRYISKKENVAQSSVVQICNKVKATGSVKDLPKSQCSNAVEIQNHLRIYENIETEMLRTGAVLSGLMSPNLRYMNNDSKHTAVDTKIWFYHNGIEVLDWPSYSPNLNSIKHLWNEIDRRRRRLYVEINDPDELWKAIQKVQAEIDMDYLNKLIDSMPQQVMDVYNAKRGYTEW